MPEKKGQCLYCFEEFDIPKGVVNKKFCCKLHKDRYGNARFATPEPVEWEEIDHLRHFSKLSRGARHRVLKGGPLSFGKEGVRVVMFDIEATHLKANVGRILCCSFKPLGGEVFTLSALDSGMRRKDVYDDSRLAAEIRDVLEEYDIIVGWNSKEFDLKYINARNMRAGQRTKRPQYHLDGMWAWRSKAAAWSSLDSAQKFIAPDGEAKTAIDWQDWMRALGWSKQLREEAMEWITEHCEQDVKVLEEVYLKMVDADVFRSLRLDGGIL